MSRYTVQIDSGTAVVGFAVDNGRLDGPLPTWLSTVARREDWDTPRAIVAGARRKGWVVDIRETRDPAPAILILHNGARMPYWPDPDETRESIIERSLALPGRIPLVGSGRVVDVVMPGD
ncbi:MAG TPA: hypothetical protein VIG24_14770 [Acidimicrobiia bacterium]